MHNDIALDDDDGDNTRADIAGRLRIDGDTRVSAGTSKLKIDGMGLSVSLVCAQKA